MLIAPVFSSGLLFKIFFTRKYIKIIFYYFEKNFWNTKGKTNEFKDLSFLTTKKTYQLTFNNSLALNSNTHDLKHCVLYIYLLISQRQHEKHPSRKGNHFKRQEAFCSNKLKQAKLRAWENGSRHDSRYRLNDFW